MHRTAGGKPVSCGLLEQRPVRPLHRDLRLLPWFLRRQLQENNGLILRCEWRLLIRWGRRQSLIVFCPERGLFVYGGRRHVVTFLSAADHTPRIRAPLCSGHLLALKLDHIQGTLRRKHPGRFFRHCLEATCAIFTHTLPSIDESQYHSRRVSVVRTVSKLWIWARKVTGFLQRLCL